jgi:hypothetical protein
MKSIIEIIKYYKSIIIAWRWLIKDILKIFLPKIFHFLFFRVIKIINLIFPKKTLPFIMRMNRYTTHNLWDEIFIKNFKIYLSYINESEINSNYEKRVCLRRSLIVKMPLIVDDLVVEKGVIILTFTPTFDYFFKNINIPKLLASYYIVLEPSWAGYCDRSILQWALFEKHPIIVQSSEKKDRIFLNSLKSNLIPVDFGASDWVDHRIFKPLRRIEKIYDSIYVTSYQPGKRHHVYFKAISKIKDPNYRAAIACASWGPAKKEILQLLIFYGIENIVDIYESLSQKDLNILLNKSKVNVLFSRKEGSNRSIFEGFFANVPAIVTKNNIGVNKNYINKYTGLLVNEADAYSALIYFKDHWRIFKPRNWAIHNISVFQTTSKLNTKLKRIAEINSERWTQDIVPKVNRPEIEYFFKNDKFLFPTTDKILNQFQRSNNSRIY